MKRRLLYAITFMSVLLILTGCFGGSRREFDYNGDYPELYTVAIHSLLGVDGSSVSERILDSEITIVETDDYGRTLFFYHENNIYALLISQGVKDDQVEFYPDYNFILTKSVSYNYYSDDGSWLTMTGPELLQAFGAEEVAAMKAANDWNREPDFDNCVAVQITRNKENGPVEKNQVKAFYHEALSHEDSGFDYADSWNDSRSLRYLTSDFYGRSIYFGSGRITTDRIVVLLFEQDGSYDPVRGRMELARDESLTYQDQLRELKELNGWGQTPDFDYIEKRDIREEHIENGDFIYVKANGKATIVQYTGTAAKVVIPAEMHGLAVTEIGENAFYFCEDLKQVIIPGSVKVIGDKAFAGCVNLMDVTFPGRLTTIGEKAFYRCESLTDLTIPGSVSDIGEQAFRFCESLTDLSIHSGVKKIGTRAFSDCVNLRSVSLPDSVSVLGDSLFYRCVNLEAAKLPVSLTSVPDQTFMYCRSLNDVLIPDAVTRIGKSAFEKCLNLTDMLLPETVSMIGEQAFQYCEKLSGIKLPDQLASIGEGAFAYCYGISSLRIPGSVKDIPSSAFSGLKNLTDLTLEDGIETIGHSAFSDSGLSTLTIPASITQVSPHAFNDRDGGLKTIYFEGAAPEVGYYAFGIGKKHEITLYHKQGAEGWTDPWNDYDTETY